MDCHETVVFNNNAGSGSGVGRFFRALFYIDKVQTFPPPAKPPFPLRIPFCRI